MAFMGDSFSFCYGIEKNKFIGFRLVQGRLLLENYLSQYKLLSLVASCNHIAKMIMHQNVGRLNSWMLISFIILICDRFLQRQLLASVLAWVRKLFC